MPDPASATCPIKTPTRCDFTATSGMLTFTLDNKSAEYISRAIDSHAALTAEVARLREALEKIVSVRPQSCSGDNVGIILNEAIGEMRDIARAALAQKE